MTGGRNPWAIAWITEDVICVLGGERWDHRSPSRTILGRRIAPARRRPLAPQRTAGPAQKAIHEALCALGKRMAVTAE